MNQHGFLFSILINSNNDAYRLLGIKGYCDYESDLPISFPEQTLSLSASTSPNSQCSSAARAETLSDALGTRACRSTTVANNVIEILRNILENLKNEAG